MFFFIKLKAGQWTIENRRSIMMRDIMQTLKYFIFDIIFLVMEKSEDRQSRNETYIVLLPWRSWCTSLQLLPDLEFD